MKRRLYCGAGVLRNKTACIRIATGATNGSGAANSADGSGSSRRPIATRTARCAISTRRDNDSRRIRIHHFSGRDKSNKTPRVCQASEAARSTIPASPSGCCISGAAKPAVSTNASSSSVHCYITGGIGRITNSNHTSRNISD
jgi:hypothetical protein